MIKPHWTEPRLAILRAFCDTVFPVVDVPDDPDGFWKRTASELGVDRELADTLDTNASPAVLAGLLQLIDALGWYGLVSATGADRERVLRELAGNSREAAAGVTALVRLASALCYLVTDERGSNPNWRALAYPGPLRAAPLVPKPIQPVVIDRDEVTIGADVCVIGSGAGGGVMAGELTRRGMQVVVLEAGGYYNESDFNHLERWSYRNLYWRGGQTPTADGNVRLLAGAALGGGTLVNWENCVRAPAWVRQQWARQYGLEGLDGAEYTAHEDAVMQRLLANTSCSDLNGPHLRLQAGTKRLGYRFTRTFRNVDRRRYDAETAGYHGFGDITGSRQGTLNTYLLDAHAAGAQVVVRARAERILTAGGRAAAVVARCVRADGGPARLTVRADRVVVAGGALETPGVLLRSGIGGRAAGDYLRLHPCVAVGGSYAEDQRSWWGPPQAAICDEFVRAREDHGFLIEGIHHGLAVPAALLPWRSGREHKTLMKESANYAVLIAIVRDRGYGRVRIDGDGQSVMHYPVDDALDLENLRHGTRELALVHEAAGARTLVTSARLSSFEWKRGQDLEAWLRSLDPSPREGNNQSLFSAHQMGSARMGTDPETSVANPEGELHDTPGVWIGDTSAFPTAPGVNPMITCMALAARTASRIR